MERERHGWLRWPALAVFAAAVGLGALSGPARASAQAATLDSLRSNIISIAHSQLGIGENPPGSNCTKYGACQYWCSDFATWVWRQAGVNIASMPYSGSVAAWGQRNGHLRAPGQLPQPGDTVMWGTWSHSNHISVVYAVDSSNRTLESIDGNWGNKVSFRSWYSFGYDDPSDGSIYAVVSPETINAGTQPPSNPPGPAHPAYPGHYIQYGDTGSNVVLVQRALHITADGDFGPITKSAVESFQRADGLQVDGIVGPQTWAALFGSVPPKETHPYPGHYIQYGDTGSNVVLIQQALGVSADGDFGPVTEQAVKNFQSRTHIQVDGIVGPQTWTTLFG